jgi:hypothetical protein
MRMEIHMGVTASPAPRMTPERDWVTAMPIKPMDRIRINRIPVSMMASVLVNRLMMDHPKIRTASVMTTDTPTASKVPCLAPCWARSSFPALMFCPVKVVIAIPKEKLASWQSCPPAWR